MFTRGDWRRYKTKAIVALAVLLLAAAIAAMVAFAMGSVGETWLWSAVIIAPGSFLLVSSEAPPPPPNAWRRLPKPQKPCLDGADMEAWRNAILAAYKDNHEYIRHHEAQRSTASTLTVTGAAAAVAASLYDRALTSTDVAPLLIAVALGLFGVLFSRKQYERTRMHVERVDALMDEYAATLHGNNVIDVIDFADAHHRASWGSLRYLPLNRLWQVVHIFLVFVGVALLIQVYRSSAKPELKESAPRDQSFLGISRARGETAFVSPKGSRSADAATPPTSDILNR